LKEIMDAGGRCDKRRLGSPGLGLILLVKSRARRRFVGSASGHDLHCDSPELPEIVGAMTPQDRPRSRRVARRRTLVAAALVCTVAAALSAAWAQSPRFFRIASGSTSGSNFLLGGAIAAAISNPPGSRPCDRGGSCGVPGLVAVAQTTQGAVENAALIARGAADAAIVQADVAYWAYHGTGPFAGKGAVANLRAVATLYPEVMHVVAPAQGDIRGIADLRLRRVSLGEQGSGTLVNARAVLKAHGMEELDVVPFYLQAGAAADLLAKDGLDAFFVNAGLPSAAVAELARSMPIRLLPVAGAQRDALRRDFPFFAAWTVPAGAYAGTAATETISVATQLLVGAGLDDRLVYGIAAALWHPATQKLLEAAGPLAAAIARSTALEGLAVPLHPGAALWYFEQGMIQGDTQHFTR
jgi:TRAP transporter TAXI family solute receptor